MHYISHYYGKMYTNTIKLLCLVLWYNKTNVKVLTYVNFMYLQTNTLSINTSIVFN